MKNDFNQFAEEILNEIKTEEKIKEKESAQIIKNGCLHTKLIKKKSLVYNTEWLECAVCGKQYNLDGTPVEEWKE